MLAENVLLAEYYLMFGLWQKKEFWKIFFTRQEKADEINETVISTDKPYKK